MGKTPNCTSDELKKGAWTPEEDQKLFSYIQKHGEGGWRFLPQKAGLQRCGKSCRLRWANYLRPGIKRGDFTAEEDQTIIKLHAELGNRWATIARHLPRRTDHEVKNYWHAHLKKRLVNSDVYPAADDSSSSGGNSNITTFGTADPLTETECAKPQQSEPTTQHSGSGSATALLLNKLATRVNQCIGPPRASQTLQQLMAFNVNGNSENSDILCHPSSSCTVPVPESSALWAESGNAIDEDVSNDIMASEFASLSCVDELNDWQNNSTESGKIQVDNYGGLWDDDMIDYDDEHMNFGTVGSPLEFYNSKLFTSTDDSMKRGDGE
ncbi:hypothetical protein V6N13_125220 [Hibiscus sabdariffa]|uniref:Uncharacterized protein n=1 Tax=Hibiscus sabdariffa TaxID=183260 RepID=A0ABR2U5B3_9ROSI